VGSFTWSYLYVSERSVFETAAWFLTPVVNNADLFVSQLVSQSMFHILTCSVCFETIGQVAMSVDQKKRLLKAKIAVALHDELGRVPKEEEINQVFLLTRVMYKAVLGLHFKRQEQKQTGQLAIF
jgi:hypothetical protein